ncbi:hypothetical protein GC093_04895 [Paenibacillus sp. LMG 31456]|uniref:Uncharacterized protein n=1 Tax=Paenibacillus foliorum TaxID=2654974 RepID=A0A972GKT2_9BACL|nr:hypothetical protein [Paenibacillus foliorum]NOU92569.1 hypothetical protein [Paenibacillus foliorum]
MLTIWMALIWFGYSYLTPLWSNGPIYFFALTATILPLYTVLYRSFKHYMDAGWLLKKHVLLVFLMIVVTIALFKVVVMPLSEIDID